MKGRTPEYTRIPLGIAFQKSNRKNAKVYIKELKSMTIDDVLDRNFNVQGISKNAIIKDFVQGEELIKKLKKKYNGK